MQLETIAKKIQPEVIACYWVMLRECERTAVNDDDPVLKLLVEGFYRKWNEMTSDNKQPRWAK